MFLLVDDRVKRRRRQRVFVTFLTNFGAIKVGFGLPVTVRVTTKVESTECEDQQHSEAKMPLSLLAEAVGKML